MGRVRNNLSLIAVTAIVATGAAGCAGMRPGVAVNVGDDRITDAQVAEYTDGFCQAISRQLEGEGTVHPKSAISRYVVTGLMLRSAAEQLAEEYGVGPGPAYAERRTALEGTAEQLPEAAGEALVTLESGSAYVQDVLGAVGEQVLAGQGVAEPSTEDAFAAGKDTLGVWLAQADPRIDPKYGLAMGDVEPNDVDESTSFAYSELAKSARSTDEADYEGYVDALPDDQTCGR